MHRITVFAILAGSLAFGQTYAPQSPIDPNFFIKLAKLQGEQQAADCPHTAISSKITDAMRQSFYCLHEGSDLLPISWLRVLPGGNGKPFLDPQNLSRYGLLPDPFRPGKMIGLTEGSNGMLGVNCAACHVSQIELNGTHLIDGGPSFFDSETFAKDMLQSLRDVLTPSGFLQFVENLENQHKLDSHLVYKVKRLDATYWPDWALWFLGKFSDTSKDSLLVYKTVPGVLKEAREFLNNPTGKIKAGLQDMRVQDFVSPPQSLTSPEDLITLARYLRERIRYFTILQSLDVPGNTSFGPGRVDDFGGARGVIWPGARVPLIGPVRYIDLWSFQIEPKDNHSPDSNYRWVHWDLNMNSAFDRNLGQAITGGALYGQPDKGVITVDAVAIGELDQIARRFEPPKWPGKPPVPALVATGKTLFDEKCSYCHAHDQMTADAKTDLKAATVYTTKMPPPDGRDFVRVAQADLKDIKTRVLAGFKPEDRAIIDPVGDKATWKPQGQYVPRSLRGIWAAGPYLHNGSILSLRALLYASFRNDPPKAKFRLDERTYRDTDVGYVYKACTDPASFCFDTALPGNSSQGHEHKELTSDQVDALLEYLKTL